MSDSTSTTQQGSISLRCACGQRFQVAANLRGKRVRCTSCPQEMRVPSARLMPVDSNALLASLGIDPEAARQAYEQERRSKLRCSLCAKKLEEQERPASEAPSEDELVCSSCRAGEVDTRGPKTPAKAKVREVARQATPRELQQRAAAYAALFLVGFAGLSYQVLGVGLVVALLIGAVVAFLGGSMIYKLHAEPVATA